MKIEELLVKHILGFLNKEEERALQEWLDEDPAHVAYLRKLQLRRNYRELYRVYCEKRPQSLSVIRKFNWKRMAARAAMWVLPVILVFSLWLGLRSPEQSNEILPGSPKATLYLENGAVVELGNSKELGWIRISDDFMAADVNGRLNYHTNHKVQLNQQNTLVTPRGGEYHIILPDGTNVHLNSFSELKYPLLFDADKRVVTLSGEAYFEVAPDKNRPFYVETEEVKIRVLGTVFDVNTHYTRGVRTVLVEGAVALEWGDQKEIRMKPGELADFDRTTTEVTLKEVDVTSYISWKEGYFVFEDEPLEEIMHTLSLWYDKEFLFVGKRSRTLHFSGHIKRYERIETILSAITEVTGVEFRMNGQIILIR